MYVRPKKFLGQHFLTDRNIAGKIVRSLAVNDYKQVLEVGPGTGILTGLLLERKDIDLFMVEVDRESAAYLREKYGLDRKRLLEADFLRLDLSKMFNGPFGVIGNFPYFISGQIMFRILDYRLQVREVVCMLQKEVAVRITAPPGSRTYGILSVLLQAFFNIEYLFTVGEKVFSPPPKVRSAVIRLTRNNTAHLPCDEELFFHVVKTGFNQRRKILKNSLKGFLLPLHPGHPFLKMRPEQLDYQSFIELTRFLDQQYI